MHRWKAFLIYITIVLTTVKCEPLMCKEPSYEGQNLITDNPGSWCVLGDVTDLQPVTFPDEEKLALVRFNITHLSKPLLKSATRTRELAVISSRMETIYLKPTLFKLTLNSTTVTDLVIEPYNDYELQELFIHEAYLTKVPPRINYLNKLEDLHLCDLKIRTVNVTVFDGLKHLQSLCMVDGLLVKFNIVPVHLPKLTSLNLSGNKLFDVPSNLKYLPTLEYLSLSNNKLTFVEMGQFNGLDRLKKLDLSRNGLQAVFTLPTVYLPALTELDFSNCKLNIMCMRRWVLPLLRKLNVEQNALARIANFPMRPDSPIELHYSGNQLQCSWITDVQPTAAFIGAEDCEEMQQTEDGICCEINRPLLSQLGELERKIKILGYQNRVIYGKLNY